jgi:hypothetical protein
MRWRNQLWYLKLLFVQEQAIFDQGLEVEVQGQMGLRRMLLEHS